MSNQTKISKRAAVVLAVGTGLSISLPSVSLADQHSNPFNAQPVEQSMSQFNPTMDKTAHGQCGSQADAKGQGGQCGHSSTKDGEGNCGSNKAQDGQCGGAQNGTNGKGSEGKCGVGKCGSGQ